MLRPFGENQLWFARYEPDTPLLKNRYDIAEPEIDHVRRVEAFALDLVLAPLVGFDAHGNRLVWAADSTTATSTTCCAAVTG